MVCLVKEDGSIVANANTYIDGTDAESLLNTIGETLEDFSEREIELHLFKAMRQLESYRNTFQGSKVSSTQSLQFPRQYVVIDGYDIASDEIPYELKMSQAVITLLLLQGEELQVSTDGSAVISESIGPISVQYTPSGSTSSEVHNPILDTYLTCLLKSPQLKVWRS